MSIHPIDVLPKEALQRLVQGNRQYLQAKNTLGDISVQRRVDTWQHGQEPYAIIITCSDARVIPEAIFSAGLGDLFVIRVAGNVIDDHQLGSVEYAASHLGCGLVVVLGHTHCGAVNAAIHHDPEGYIRFITDEIRAAIGEETDDYRACCLNIRHSMAQVRQELAGSPACVALPLRVIGAVYDIETGQVEFLEG